MMIRAARTPSTAPSTMNTPMRGTRRTVASTIWLCSVADMPLFSHRAPRSGARTGSRTKRQHVAQIGADTGCLHTTLLCGIRPRQLAHGERNPRGGVDFDDVRRGATRVAGAL